jgi:hypothetical protein
MRRPLEPAVGGTVTEDPLQRISDGGRQRLKGWGIAPSGGTNVEGAQLGNALVKALDPAFDDFRRTSRHVGGSYM